MCGTALHECHTENWVWVVLQAEASCSLFSDEPIGGWGVGGGSSCCGGGGGVGFLDFPLRSPAAPSWAAFGHLRRLKPEALLQSRVAS